MIDQKWQHQNILLILCGSSVSFMVNDVMGYESPLYGRRTVNMELKPLNYHEASQFFPDFTDEDKIKAYCILGGIPYYLNLFDDKLSIKENISNTIFKDISVLRDEPMFLLKQEFRELSIYNSIIEAIATGSSKFNEISQKIHEPSSKCSIYLKNLKEVGIVDKVLPYGEKEDSKKSIYEISDFYFRFWYRFVFANSSVLALLGEKDYTNLIYEDIPSVLGNQFEKVCLQYMILLAKSGRLPFVPKGLSRWWGNDPISKKQNDIDILGINGNKGIFCECKFKNKEFDLKVFEDLIHASNLFEDVTEKYYYIFVRSGYTQSVIDESKKYNVKLLTISDLFSFESA